MMICPRCQSTEYYKLNGRNFVRCKKCKRDFSETSGTIWKYQKMAPERHQEIIDRLHQGKNAHVISLEMGIQYKTIWGIAKKMEAEWERIHPAEPVTFLVGDVVSRVGPAGYVVTAFVTGMCGNDRFIRVRDDNGRHRIWLKANLVNDDDAVRRATAHLNGGT